MKKFISLLGALFLGSIAFSQSSKTDSTAKTNARKVSPSDVKTTPVAPANKPNPADIKVKNSKSDSVSQKGSSIPTQKSGGGSNPKK